MDDVVLPLVIVSLLVGVVDELEEDELGIREYIEETAHSETYQKLVAPRNYDDQHITDEEAQTLVTTIGIHRSWSESPSVAQLRDQLD